jgi:hypothetical protein
MEKQTQETICLVVTLAILFAGVYTNPPTSPTMTSINGLDPAKLLSMLCDAADDTDVCLVKLDLSQGKLNVTTYNSMLRDKPMSADVIVTLFRRIEEYERDGAVYIGDLDKLDVLRALYHGTVLIGTLEHWSTLG